MKSLVALVTLLGMAAIAQSSAQDVANLNSLGAVISRNPNDPAKAVVAINVGLKKIGDNDLKGVLRGFQSLKVLILSRTGITDVTLDEVKDLKKLEELYLLRTAVSDEGVLKLQGLASLRILNLNNTKITDKSLTGLKALLGLKQLDISRTNITDKGLKDVAALAQLELLSLNNTNISDVGLKQLAGLVNLKMLSVLECDLTEEAVNELCKTLPGCNVLYAPKLQRVQESDCGELPRPSISQQFDLPSPKTQSSWAARCSRGLMPVLVQAS